MMTSGQTEKLLTGLVVAAALAAVACGGDAVEPMETATPPARSAKTLVASVGEVPLATELTGTVGPWTRVSLGTKILGRVDEVRVDVGDRVERGQVLALLERRDLDAAVRQATAAVGMAEAQSENARAQYKRMQELHRRGSVTDKGLEDATAAFHVSEAAVDQARANLAAAEVTLGYAEIRASTAGYVTAKRVSAGDMARPGEPLIVVEDLSRVKVSVAVPEADVVGLKHDSPARVVIEALGEEREAAVETINPAGDPHSRSFEVELALDNPKGRLKSGMFVRAWFDQGSREALFVPLNAVVERGALHGIFVVDAQGLARLRWIRTGRVVGDQVEILSGLRAGERYVLGPPLGFADGTPVREG